MKNKITKNWYRFLTEEVTEETFGDPYLSVGQLEKLFKVFHLSEHILGDSQHTGEFEFTPRIPREPMSGEDDFTKRISLAPNIGRAVYALDSLPLKYQKKESYRKYYVYAGDLKADPTDDISTIKLNVELTRCNKDLSYIDTKDKSKRKYSNYKYDSSVSPWNWYAFKKSLLKKELGIEHCYQASRDPEKYNKCYPIEGSSGPLSLGYSGRDDLMQKFYACVPDANDTREEWATNNISLYFIGELDRKNSRIYVDKNSLNLIKSKLRQRKVKEKYSY